MIPEPQAGILPEPLAHALFLILRVRNPAKNGRPVARVAGAVPRLAKNVGQTDPSAKLVCNVGFGPRFWNAISPGRRPAGLRPFKALKANNRAAPNTGGDVLVHIISDRLDLNFELALQLRAQMGDAVRVMDEVHGFRYLDGRDLTGFIDGTENPKGKDRAKVALIGAEDPRFAGGSYVFTQRYVHNLKKWGTVSVRDQEKVIGRRKRDSRELSANARPYTAHISRVMIDENGAELEIVRHSFPYGTVSESGLFFLAYSRSLAIPEKMLARMIGTGDDGLHDHLMNYSHAVSGATFFAPSVGILSSLARR